MVTNLAVGFDVLTVVTVKSTTLWEATSCSPREAYRHSGGTYSPLGSNNKSNILLRNVGELLPDYVALYPRR
jgi:hypothetical protein